jgi:hypothetical protein
MQAGVQQMVLALLGAQHQTVLTYGNFVDRMHGMYERHYSGYY